VLEREAYLASGGHGHPEVRGLVLENVALGKVFSRAGLPVACVGGRGSVSFRMYPEGPAQLSGGWARAVALGAGSTSPLLLGLVIAWISGANLTLIEITTAAVAGSPGPLLVAAVLYLAYAVQVRWMLVRIGSFSWHTALLFPLHVVFMNLVFAWSALGVLFRRRVQWKGRQVPVGGTPR
jgi:4,4'-diaponeurosporenoate glycosyltransferase